MFIGLLVLYWFYRIPNHHLLNRHKLNPLEIIKTMSLRKWQEFRVRDTEDQLVLDPTDHVDIIETAIDEESEVLKPCILMPLRILKLFCRI